MQTTPNSSPAAAPDDLASVPVGPLNGPLNGPLHGLRILDMTSVLMGPYATQILGDLGADVIKIESPQGDSMRHIGPMNHPGMGPIYLHINRNKRSLVLDLKQADGLDALRHMLASADVLVYNVRPQAMARLGLDYASVAKINPGIVYAGLFGFSQRGPYAPQAAFDDLIQAGVGLSHATAAGNGGVPRYVPTTIADRSVGLYAVGMINAAIIGRLRTGKGCELEVPMFETMAQYVMGDHLYGQTFVPARGDYGYPRLLAAERRPYRTLDGYLCCLVYTDAQWRDFLRLTGRERMYDDDPRFADIGTRTRHINELYGLVGETLLGRTSRAWQDLFANTDITIFPAHDFESLLDDEHLRAIDFFRTVEHPSEGAIRVMASPAEWSGAPLAMRRHAPRLGEHSVEVLREFGLGEDAIATLLASGVTRAPA